MNLQVIKNRVKKVFVYTSTSIVFLLISGLLILQMPPVQNRIIAYYLKDFSSITGFKSEIKVFRMLWFDRLELEGVRIIDPSGLDMISVHKVLINFNLLQLFDNTNINVDGIFVDSAHVFVTRIPIDTVRDFNINIFVDRINEQFASTSGKPKRKRPRVNVGEAFVNRSQFTYIDQDKDSVLRGFNYNQFALDIDEGQLKGLVIKGDTTEFQVRTVIAQDKGTKFTIKHLATFFRFSRKSMDFIGLHLETPLSLITDTIRFSYDKKRDLSDFVNKVRVHADLNHTVIHPADLAVFAPQVEKLQHPLELTGIFDGKISRFKLKQMDISYGNSRLAGDLDMDGLPNFNETFIILNLKKSKLAPEDLAPLTNEATSARLETLGNLDMDAQFLGYPYDFVANGSFSGKLGNIQSDINFKVDEENFDLSQYSGKLALNFFDLGTFVGDTANFQKVTLKGNISGKGLSKKSADFILNGNVSSIGIKHYDYTNIVTNARFAYERIRGSININDPNLEFSAKGSIDLRNNVNIIAIEGKLDTAYVHHLKLSRDYLFLHGQVKADMSIITVDELEGNVKFSDLFVVYKDQSLRLEQFELQAVDEGVQRNITLRSNLIDADVEGNFLLSNLIKDAQTLSYEIFLNIKNDQKALQDYYRAKTYRPAVYETELKLNLKNIAPLTQLLHLDLDLSANTMVEARFTSGLTSIFNAYAQIDSIHYNGKLFLQSEAELTASKMADSTSVLGMMTLTSEKQLISPAITTKDLLVEGIWNRNRIDFGLDVDQMDQPNYIRLKGAVSFLLDSTIISLEPSELHVLDRNWRFTDDNRIVIKGPNWKFYNVTLSNNNQYAALHGTISRDPSQAVTLSLQNLDLALLNAITKEKIMGSLNAEVVISDVYNQMSVQNAFVLEKLSINDFLVGDVRGNNVWDTLSQAFNVHLEVERNAAKVVDITGRYTPAFNSEALDLHATFEKANVKLLEPFLKGIFSKMGGDISGSFTINGSLDKPLIAGAAEISDGQLLVDYLKTFYRFKGTIEMQNNAIVFREIELTDAFRNKGTLNGRILHRAFSDMSIDMRAQIENFQVLNTSSKDNDTFYGQAYATGTVDFTGPFNNLKISSTARTERNTRFYVPIGNSNSLEKKDFIPFVNFKDTTFTRNIILNAGERTTLTGVAIDFNLDITPDAYCEIIFDLKSGDIIRGRGNGDLRLQMDTKGEFTMFGPFEFTTGWYNFTLYDIINKEFEIGDRSRITWYGDPYQAIMDIHASYNQLASLGPLINDPAVAGSSQLRRKYPVQVLLNLQGPMLSPEISFDIQAKDLPKSVQTENGFVNPDIVFAAFKSSLDEQELKRQVFSLIVLRKFSPPQSFNTSGSVVNSVSELLSNQLSYWMSQVDENLEIDVDLGTMDEEAFNTFQLRFSYTFLNGRLRVTGDGTFNNNTSAASSQSPSSLTGDWTVDYMLTPDGKLRVKMYSRTNVNPILSSVNNQNTLTTGASLIHTQSFDKIRDLWSSERRKRKRKEETLQTNQDAIKEEDGTE